MSRALIEIEDIVKEYHTGDVCYKALRGVSLSIKKGEFVAIMGPSGSGKSTLMHILGLLDVPSGGKFYFDGKRTDALEESELAVLRNKKIGFVFQAFNLLPRTSALDNVKVPMMYAGVAMKEQNERARQALIAVGLEAQINNMSNQLSGGQQQRVAIARALINKPQVIFADEPTGNLDSKSSKDIMEILTQLNKEGNTIVMVTHEDEVAAIAKRVIVIKDGNILSDK